MNAPLLPPEKPNRAASPLRARRCVRHPAREAAARCPSCGGFFCRECVVEHEGRVLCADCLARVATKTERQRRRWKSAGRVASTVLAGAVAWASFYALGWLLLKIPPSFHEGTIWKTAADE